MKFSISFLAFNMFIFDIEVRRDGDCNPQFQGKEWESWKIATVKLKKLKFNLGQ